MAQQQSLQSEAVATSAGQLAKLATLLKRETLKFIV